MSLLENHDEDDTVHRLTKPDDPVMIQWARFRDRIAEAMDASLDTIAELEQRIANRRAFLFAGKDSAIVGQCEPYPGGSMAMQLLWACGDIPEIVSLLPGIESIARMQGCDRMIVEGPMAWQRVLKGSGYDFFSVTLSKGL